MASYASQLPEQVPWRRSAGPMRRTANRETHKCRLAPSHYGETGAARPSSAEAPLRAVTQWSAIKTTKTPIGPA